MIFRAVATYKCQNFNVKQISAFFKECGFPICLRPIQYVPSFILTPLTLLQPDGMTTDGSRLRADAARPSRSASSSPLPQLPMLHRQASPTRGLNRDHIHSASSDSGLGKSLGSTPPPSPFVAVSELDD